jgi:serine/threonine-protein kinase
MASLPPLPMQTKRQGLYVHPASHGGAPSGPADSLPYGSRLRLKSAFDVNAFSTNVAARVILRSMQRYGIVLADGGNVALTSEDDMFTTHKWLEFGFDENNLYLEQMLVGVQVTDFEVVETGPQILLTYDCVRVPDDFLFIDEFDF